MSEDDERFVILKFSDQDDLKKFFTSFKQNDLGELFKVGSDPDGRNNQKKSNNGKNKETKWSDWGLKSYDEKSKEKPSLI